MNRYRLTGLLLNFAHAIDHMFLLIFATAVATIAADFGFERWEDLMPYSVGAFFMFGVGAIPAGRLGDLWGRHQMMLLFFFGMGVSSILVAMSAGPWSIAVALTLLGAFSSIYHPVGIPMLVRNSLRPGMTIGVNGLAGNLGIAFAALVTGFLVKHLGWRAAFFVPGLVSLACGFVFLRTAERESEAPARRKPADAPAPAADMARVLAVMTMTAVTGALLFNFTTNGNAQLLRERFAGIIEDPAVLGALLAGAYTVASVTQVIVGRMIDRLPLKRLYLSIVAFQAPLFALAGYAEGWALLALLTAFMVSVFGAIPFTDAMIYRYFDDSMRSRVTGIRFAISFGVSSLAVWLLGPVVKAAGFDVLLFTMAVLSLVTLAFITQLPESQSQAEAQRA